MSLALLLPGLAVLLCAVMALGWVVQRRMGNAGWVDVVWSFGLGLAGVLGALAPVPGVGWPGARQIVVAVLAGAWSLRLGLHIMERTRRGPEDRRYARFRVEWAPRFEARLFGFLQIQAACAWVLALSIVAAARNPAPLGWGDAAGLVILAAAIVGEAAADAELRRFRADPAHHGLICESGLWGLSRHPNYFFEWLGWVAYPCFAISAGYGLGWVALSGPVFMYWLLVHVSGIPPLEAEMLKSRGEAFRDYQSRTRAFLPLPRRRTS